MNSSESDPSLSAADQQFSLIMDEIVDTIRNGQALSVEDWVKRYPQYEKQLRDFLPVLAFAEDINEEPTDDKYSKSSSQHPFASSSLAVDTCPERLGDFEIKCELGRGGMGVVYSAWQHSLRRPVALKILAQHLTRDARFVARFQREAQSAARLNHPNLVQVYGIGQDQGVWYYAMQLIDGSTISDVLQHLSKIQKGSHPQSNFIKARLILGSSQKVYSSVTLHKRHSRQTWIGVPTVTKTSMRVTVNCRLPTNSLSH